MLKWRRMCCCLRKNMLLNHLEIIWRVRSRLSFRSINLTVYPGGAQKADQVFLPVLENASKAQKLRTMLGVFDRSKFFFNLPSFIMESIEAVSSSLHLWGNVHERANFQSRDDTKLLFGTTRRASICLKTVPANFYLSALTPKTLLRLVLRSRR